MMRQVALFLCCSLLVAAPAVAWEPDSDANDANKEQLNKEQLIQKLARKLTGCTMKGRFTILGKDDKPPAEESYQIVQATKLDEGETWLIQARVKYGDKDVNVPVPVEIVWAGDTPVITLTQITIPGMGAGFSCRIVIYENLYAGTWGHGKTVGHMFGSIVPSNEEKEKPADGDK